ncbi:MAG: hypothetical protein K6G90_02320 [Clostridia bacterium]|nr:hypothetical protein [Clostridia bacterium]
MMNTQTNKTVNDRAAQTGTSKKTASVSVLICTLLAGVLAIVNACAVFFFETGISIRYIGPRISAILSAVIGVVLLVRFVMLLIRNKKKTE